MSVALAQKPGTRARICSTLAEALAVHGNLMPVPLPPPAEPGVAEILARVPAFWANATVVNKWRKANPREAVAIETYWRDGGNLPEPRTAFGKGYLEIARAYRMAL